MGQIRPGLVSLPHVDLHQVQLGLMRRQATPQLCPLLSPLVLLCLQGTSC